MWILLLLAGFLVLLYGAALMPVLIAPAVVVLLLCICIFWERLTTRKGSPFSVGTAAPCHEH
jgi:hypothetical protein